MHRIPHARNQTVGDRQPVLLMHGVLASSAQFVEMGPDNGLAFILADEGYDVWLGNARGNSYSQKHDTYSPDDLKFWDFSWHEIGLYDLRAMIDFILETTSRENMFYVGYSQGTTAAFVLMSAVPSYNHKIKIMIFMGPVAFLSHTNSQFLRALEPINNKFQLPLVVLGGFEFAPREVYFKKFGQNVCLEEAKYKQLCDNIVFLICGHDSRNFNETILPVILSNIPDRASTKMYHHWAQLVASKSFRDYDYGPQYNMEQYMNSTPPNYNLREVKARVALMYSTNDVMASVMDVDDLQEKLPNVVENYEVPSPDFNHVDFIWSTEAKSLVYSKLLEFLKKYRNVYSTESHVPRKRMKNNIKQHTSGQLRHLNPEEDEHHSLGNSLHSMDKHDSHHPAGF
ncbi:lipase 3-like [Periplaneta americana]|uniref:lipase 3-like n=1 Tax=Periplaneta americana TaxID=6978 RepID=UPI0037E771A5